MTIPRGGRRRQAFTLIELMIALLIGITFLLGVWQLMTSGSRLFRKADASLEAVQATTLVTTYITNDLKNLTVPPTQMGVPMPGAAAGTTGTWYIGLEGGKPKVTKPSMKLENDGSPAVELYCANEELASTDATALTMEMMKVKKISYRLKKAGPPGLYNLVREEEGGETHTIAGSHVMYVEFRFIAAPADDITAAAVKSPSNDLNKPNLYFCQLVVVGASSAKLEKGNGQIATDAEYYNVPLVSTVQLDQVSEMLSNRGLARFWNWTPSFLGTPTN